VTEIFFGNEDEEDARFVYLFECKHLLEVSGLDHWIKSRFGADAEDKEKMNSIKLPECPKCKTPLRRNTRYANYIKQQLMLIESIKKKQLFHPIEENAIRYRLNNQLRELLIPLMDNTDQKLKNELEENLNRRILTKIDFTSIENKLNVFKGLLKLREAAKTKLMNSAKKEDVDWQTAFIGYELTKLRNMLWKTENMQEQTIKYISNQLTRMQMLLDYFQMQNFAKKSNEMDSILGLDKFVKIASLNARLEECLFRKVEKFDESYIKSLLDQLKKESRFSDKLSEEERVMILKAMNLQKGHWFKCPNGHVYCITECGGAMQQSKCPECGESIGGSNHTLLETNRLATEMDGARYAAWSNTANNMNNFNFNDI
jgi:hypothetical protein